MANHLVPDAVKALDEDGFLERLEVLAAAADPSEWKPSPRAVVIKESAIADNSAVLDGSSLLPTALPTCSLVPEYLPDLCDWSAGLEAELCAPDLVAAFKENRQPRALPATYKDECTVAPEPASCTIELVTNSAEWDVWRSPAEAQRYDEEKDKPPPYTEVGIDAEMMATGAESSSLRRLPTAREFQLKGSSQNTPYR